MHHVELDKNISILREIHPVVVPVTFNNLPTYVNRVWDTFEAVGTRPFQSMNTPVNKKVFKKGMLILSEAKVCYAQRAKIDKPDEDLPQKNLYTEKELLDLNEMAESLPYPLAVYLKCIGNTYEGRQIVTPVLASLQNFEASLSGAITYAPRQLLPLLRILRDGVPYGGPVHQVGLALANLPGLLWEEYYGQAVSPQERGPRMIRLNQSSSEFWIYNDKIRWTDAEHRTFVKIIQSLNSKKGFIIKTDLSHGQGSLAQTIQTVNWDVDNAVEWYTMTDCSENDQKLGIAFGFCNYGDKVVQPSRFRGTYSTAYWRGKIIPRRIMTEILSPKNSPQWT